MKRIYLSSLNLDLNLLYPIMGAGPVTVTGVNGRKFVAMTEEEFRQLSPREEDSSTFLDRRRHVRS